MDISRYAYDPNKSAPDRKEYRLAKKYEKLILAKVRTLDLDFESLNDGEQTRIITERAVNAIVALEKISAVYTIVETYICVYRMNERSVAWIKDRLCGRDVKTTILLSSFFRENKKYEKWFESVLLMANSNFIVKTGCLHAKIFCCKTACGKYFVFEGSGNLSDNARLEQYIVEQNRDVYEFHKNWMNNYGRQETASDKC